MTNFNTPLYTTPAPVGSLPSSASNVCVGSNATLFSFVKTKTCKNFVAARHAGSEVVCRFHSFLNLVVVCAASLYCASSASAQTTNGAVLAWGRNWEGQCLGTDSEGNAISTTAGGAFVQIGGVTLSGVTAIAGGVYHTIALSPIKDCNSNGIHAPVDVANGALDQNADKVPDTCQGIDQFNITSANLGVPTANVAYSHTFTNLYPTYTDATLTIRVKGDLDSANEFFTLKLNDITYTRIFDNVNSTGINCTSATNGGVSTVALTIPKATFAQYATAGQLKVTLLASPYFTAGECADGSTTVQLQFQGLTPGADCNSDTVWDLAEIYSNAALDRDLNRQLDACQIRDNPLLDRNNNGELDTYDISVNSALDCDSNMFIDQYEIVDNAALDCNQNGRLDYCDIAEGTVDCNLNGIPDSCDTLTDPSLDCDFNGKIDTCDVVAGAIDDDADGRPDACEIAKGDLDLSGSVDSGDFSILLLYYGEENPAFGDFDGSGMIDSGDAALIPLFFGEVTWP